jgi:hypothetical protein
MTEKEMLKEKILEALKEADFKSIVNDLMECAHPLLDLKNRPCGQVNGALVYDTENGKLVVLSEEYNTTTPSYVYLLTIDGDEDFSKFTEEEKEDSWLCIYESLIDMYDKVKSGEFVEGW